MNMQYLLLIYGNEAGMAPRPRRRIPDERRLRRLYRSDEEGRRVRRRREAEADQRRPPRVRITGGKTKVLDGPYAETKEQLGGYYMIDVPDLDAAIVLGGALPGRQHRHDRGAADLADGRLAIAA